MKKNFLGLMSFAILIFSHLSYSGGLIIEEPKNLSPSEPAKITKLPVGLDPILPENPKKMPIGLEPIKNSDQSSINKEIDRIKNGGKNYLNKIQEEINSPTFEYNGQRYEKDKVVEIAGGKVILTPISDGGDKTNKILPPGFENIPVDTQWVDYEVYLKQQEKLKKEQAEINKNKPKINRPDGFYNQDPKKGNYVDDFFEYDSTGNDIKEKKDIKKGINDVMDRYKIKNNDLKNNSKVSPSKPLNEPKTNNIIKKEDKKIEKGFEDLIDLYENKDRKETLGYLHGDKIDNTPKAIRKHNIPTNYKEKPVYIRVFKEENSLELYLLDHGRYKLANVYTICTFSGGLGQKKKQGDEKSPEGFYSLKPSSMNPYSSYYKSMDLGFPNAYDKAHGYTGSLLMIHGGCQSVGCYAMTDKYIDEIYKFTQAAFNNGQKEIKVDIFPFRMNSENMKKYQSNENIAFWNNLKEGYDIFEKTGTPPNVSVSNKKYIFN